MATLGYADLKDTALPTLWDEDELTKVRLQDGRTLAQLTAEVQRGLQLLNGQLLDMPGYSSLFAVQDEPELEYNVGVSNGFQEAGEYTPPDPGRGATTGHMLPLKFYDRGLGWTMRYLVKARAAKLDADVRSVMVDARNIWQQKLLARFFKMEGETVGATANASVPLADGGTTDANYVPPDSPEGESFANSHDHFLRIATLDAAAISTAVEHLQEHGHQAPFDLVGSRADAGTYNGVTGFKAPEWPQIVYQSSPTERADIGDITRYFGYIETAYGIVRLWLTPRVPTNYFGVYKPYGAVDPRNPLRVRIDPVSGFGFNMFPGTWVNAPALLVVAGTEFGVGIGEDRTNGVAVLIAGAGDYVTPTIS
jgi:hypothetical protein